MWGNFLTCAVLGLYWLLSWIDYRGYSKLTKQLENAQDEINKIVTKPSKQGRIYIALKTQFDALQEGAREAEKRCIWLAILFAIDLVALISMAVYGV